MFALFGEVLAFAFLERWLAAVLARRGAAAGVGRGIDGRSVRRREDAHPAFLAFSDMGRKGFGDIG